MGANIICGVFRRWLRGSWKAIGGYYSNNYGRCLIGGAYYRILLSKMREYSFHDWGDTAEERGSYSENPSISGPLPHAKPASQLWEENRNPTPHGDCNGNWIEILWDFCSLLTTLVTPREVTLPVSS